MADKDLDSGYSETTTLDDTDVVAIYKASSDSLWRYMTWANLKSETTAEVLGKQTIWIPASEMTPATTSGCAALATVEYQAGQVDLNVLDFDGAADEIAVFNMALPKGWDEGSVSFQLFWITGATDTDSVRFLLQARAFSDNESPAQSTGGGATVVDAAQGAANRVLVSAESDDLTIAGNPAEGDLCAFRIIRTPSDAADTLTEDARVIGIKLFFTTDAPTDD